MDIGGTEYKSFEEVEQQLGLSSGFVKKLVRRHNVPYKKMGKVMLISDDDLSRLMEKETQYHERLYQERSKRMKKVQDERKKKKGKSSTQG